MKAFKAPFQVVGLLVALAAIPGVNAQTGGGAVEQTAITNSSLSASPLRGSAQSSTPTSAGAPDAAPAAAAPRSAQRAPAAASSAANNRTPATGTAAARRDASNTNAAALASAQAVQELALPVNGQVALTLAGNPVRVSVADPSVADVQVLPPTGGARGEVLLLGKQAGATQVQVWTRGQNRPQTWSVRVISAAQNILDARGVPTGVNVDGAQDKSVLTGQSPSMITHAAAVAAAGGVDAVVDVSTVGTPSVVQVEVKVIELSRSALKEVGVNFSAGNGPWSTGSSLGNAPGIAGALSSGFNLLYASSKVDVALRLLQTNGMARTLAEPTLVALSGQSASFLAGGEIPVPESGGLGTQSIVYKPFGIGLTVTPTVLAANRIALKVAPEASELDFSNGIPISNSDGSTSVIPALRTRRADTMIELGDGESFVISGLVSRQTTSAVEKVPFLGDLPIIGAFFRSLRYSQEERELVIMVTPRLVRPIARGVSLPLPGATQERTDTALNAWGSYLIGPLGGQDMPGFSR